MSAEQARLAALGGAQPEAPVPTPEAESAPPAAGLTVGEIIERFLDSSMAVRKRTLREATRQGYRYALKPGRRTDHLRELRKLPLAELTRRHLIDLRDRGCPVELLRKLGVVLSWAEERLLIDQAPRVRLPSTGKDTRTLVKAVGDAPVDLTELRAVWKATAGLPQVWRALYRVQILTGVRPEEIERLRWEHVWLSGDTPTARIDGKMGWRDVPLIPAAVRELAPLALENDLRPTESPWVFAVPTDPAYHLYRRLDVHRKVVAASGVSGWQRKHLRKSVRTWFGRVKGDELGRWALGHGSAGIDGRYDQSDRVAKLRQAFEEFYRAIAADD